MVSSVVNAILVLCELTKGPFLGFPGKAGKEKVDFRLGRLKKPQGDGDVDISQPSIQRQLVRILS